MAAVDFGYIIPADFPNRFPSGRYTAAVTQALEMIAGQFGSAWMVDHLQIQEGRSLLEGFTAITYWAGIFPKLTFGNTVLSQSFRNPAHLAKMAATLQYLSEGRFILGIGAGWDANEYRAYGYKFPPNAVRVAQLEEALQIIRGMWAGGPFTFQGRHYQVDGARCDPLPESIPPILIGAFGPKMLRLTARYGDEWNVSSTGLQKYRRMAGDFEQACADVGRDPASVRRSWCGGIACAGTEAEAKALAQKYFEAEEDDEDFVFCGTPAQIVAQIRAFCEAGVTRFIFDFAGFPEPGCLDLVVKEVLPALR